MDENADIAWFSLIGSNKALMFLINVIQKVETIRLIYITLRFFL